MSPISRSRHFWPRLSQLGCVLPGTETFLFWMSWADSMGQVSTAASAIPAVHSLSGVRGQMAKETEGQGGKLEAVRGEVRKSRWINERKEPGKTRDMTMWDMRNNLKHFAYCVYCGLQSITGLWERRFQQIMDNLHGKTASTSSVHKQLKNNLKNRLSFMSMDTRGSGHRFHSCETYMGNRM